MKLRTEIEITPWQRTIDYHSLILSIGSCFAQNIAERLAECKFNIATSPSGILFNPASIARTIERFRQCREVCADDIFRSDGRWLSYHFHSTLSAADRDEAQRQMTSAVERGAELLESADHLIVTLGTAWTYRLRSTGEVVANCHKQPHSLFCRELLSTNECIDELQRIVDSTDPKTHIILTLSPVRHIGEGMEDNSLSKAILRVAIDEVVRRNERVSYFPSFEIMMDDLRDYRFYGDDLVHPSQMAISYITDKFFETALSNSAKEMMHSVLDIVRAAKHRPMNAASEQYRTFCQKQLAAIATLENINFDEEKRHFESMLQINL